MTDKGPLTWYIDETARLLDIARARGVTAIEFTAGELSVKANLTPLVPNELPTDQKAREALLADPRTPEEVKKRIADEDEELLFGASEGV